MMEDSVGVLSPKYNLEPPHYDGIQSLCLMGDLLFTGSRDTCIKKWDLAEQQQKHVSMRLRRSVMVVSYVYDRCDALWLGSKGRYGLCVGGR